MMRFFSDKETGFSPLRLLAWLGLWMVFSLFMTLAVFGLERLFFGRQAPLPTGPFLTLRFLVLYFMTVPGIVFHFFFKLWQARFSAIDPLTGLYNRRHVLHLLEIELERARRHKRHLSTMMIDVDDFKKINDSHGHLNGDAVLKEIASALLQTLRKSDIGGRYGGDEFLVLLPDAGSEESQTVAERFREEVRQISFLGEGISVSIGIFSAFDQEDFNLRTAIERADQALLMAKEKGKNRILAAA